MSKMMWKDKWEWGESLAICWGLLLVGFIIQIVQGPTSLHRCCYPITLYILIATLIISGVVFVIFRHSKMMIWLCSYYAAITSIITLLLLVILMGVIPQNSSSDNLSPIIRLLYLNKIIGSIPFGLMILLELVILYFSSLRRILYFRSNSFPFILNHFGLIIVQIGAIMGSCDTIKLQMRTQVGKVEWQGIDVDRNIVELPFAIELKQFILEEYPSKLLIIDDTAGQALPLNKPHTLVLDSNFRKGKLLNWEVLVEKIYSLAAPISNNDTSAFVEFYSKGGAPAVYVKAIHKSSKKEILGWVSSGSYLFPFQALRLSNSERLIMAEPEAKRYASDIIVYTKNQEILHRIVEVNKPMKIAGWNIYQVNYDHSLGRWSDISILEIIYDPWVQVVYWGIFLLILGALILIFNNKSELNEEKGGL